MSTRSYLYPEKQWPPEKLKTLGQISAWIRRQSGRTCTRPSAFGPVTDRAETSIGCSRKPEKFGGTNPALTTPGRTLSCIRVTGPRGTSSGCTITTRRPCDTAVHVVVLQLMKLKTNSIWRTAQRITRDKDGDFRTLTHRNRTRDSSK